MAATPLLLPFLPLLLLVVLSPHRTAAIWMSETAPRDDPDGCYWAGCYPGGCPKGYREVAKERCFFLGPNSEHCCPAVTCPAPTPPTGWEVGADCQRFYNKDADTCPVQCGPGLAGDPSARCTARGVWEFKGACPADPSPPSIDFPTFLLHALRSYAAYSPGQQVESGLFSANLPVFDKRSVSRAYVDGNSTLFVDYWQDGTQWLSIRGSTSALDFAEDLDTVFVFHKGLGMRLHRGFLARSVDTMHYLRQLLDPAKPVRLTGHSLGGAVAPIVALLLQKRGFNITDIVTFGAPKFTNLQGTEKVNKLPLMRITLAGDPVPPLPMINAYRQAGPEVILSNNTLDYQYLTSAQATFRARHAGHLADLATSWSNHAMLEYLAQVYARQPVPDPALGAALSELREQQQPPP
eukprot:EG_transcript_13396